MKGLTFVSLSLSAFALVLTGCPNGPGSGQDDAGTEDEGLSINVSGVATVHPEAVKYLQSQSAPVPTLEGLTLRVEEPFRVGVEDPLGIFSVETLADGGTFRAENVPHDVVTLGVAAGIRDCDADGGTPGVACTPRVVISATVLYDVALENKKPDKDIVDAKAYAIPRAFHDQLTLAVGAQNIQNLTSQTFSDLISAGFMLGQIVDAQGNPVSGATVELSGAAASLANRFFYLKGDLSGTQESTSSNGLFIYVHDGGRVNPFQFKITGKPEYLTRNAGAAKNACLVTRVYPGLVPPP